HPGPLDGHPSPAQAHRAGLVTVPRRGTRRIVAALRPTHRGDVSLHHRGQHLQTGAHRQGQQPLTNLTDQLTQHHAHLLRHSGRTRLALAVLVLLSHGGPLLRGVLGRPPECLPHGRHQAGDRRLKIYEPGDNLATKPSWNSAAARAAMPSCSSTLSRTGGWSPSTGPNRCWPSYATG